ncbi:MAG: hypothetical protein JST86_13485 [Bacteroidetes bacterium]|nr:hypothetical protein [Bacteroidota bacterium]
MPFNPVLFFCAVWLLSCNNAANSIHPLPAPVITAAPQNPYALVNDIPLPEGYTHSIADSTSFAYWLRHIALKRDKTVYLYDGSKKANQQAQFAVLDIPVGNQNLQQCADVVMHLRAAWLFHEKRFNEISFVDNENTRYAFTPPYTASHFNDYLLKVYGMCGSASLSKQLHAVAADSSVIPGDVFIRGGFPGHAVIVLDVVQNAAGKKIFLLAQGYMPAQDIHILVNPSDGDLSPWYTADIKETLLTPEYVFHSGELKRW